MVIGELVSVSSKARYRERSYEMGPIFHGKNHIICMQKFTIIVMEQIRFVFKRKEAKTKMKEEMKARKAWWGWVVVESLDLEIISDIWIKNFLSQLQCTRLSL